ncbi:hypothetical protein AMTR_s00006p00093380 [Amborella trichopoda]|uniref:Uncharacterized protein n=1 Tax=Amborella trichopoda TaxID=13333 RepID=W1PCF3_AMBTC|nr:hypothetical protein AMTR_s00006p00093380 [Amborella trichopoda]
MGIYAYPLLNNDLQACSKPTMATPTTIGDSRGKATVMKVHRGSKARDPSSFIFPSETLVRRTFEAPPKEAHYKPILQ